MTDDLPPPNPQFSTLNSQFSISGRVVRLDDGREFPLDALTDFGFLVIEENAFAIARLFRAPDGTRLLADARAFAGTPAAALERLWRGHFKRNFFLVGMEEAEFHATTDLRETVFAACRERSVRLTAPSARPLQIGHLEETPDGVRRILPRGDSPETPPLILRPLASAERTNTLSSPEPLLNPAMSPTVFRACLGAYRLSREPAIPR